MSNEVNTPASLAAENLTTRQAAAWLSRSDETLKRWRRHRIGPPYFTINGRVLYSREALAAWVEEQREATEVRSC
ncbi:helix-turn-helix domain-containing protein [Luteimonas sp. e5]